MELSRKVTIAWKALRELGLQPLGYYAWYQLQLRSGYLGWRTRDSQQVDGLPPGAYQLEPFLRLPDRDALVDALGEQRCAALRLQADEILSGKVRLFGSDPIPLDLGPAASELHWTALERGKGWQKGRDIRLTWEMGRIGWVFTLGRAYRISGEERCARFFWERWEEFLHANPPYYGAHWMSAQEVAIRLIALCFAAQVFSDSAHSTPDRKLALGQALAVHACRIPPSLAYARAQGNNHLLVEAAGIYTAGCALGNHPRARHWRELGWRWVNRALQEQIATDGAYIQNSANYHRLMLQAALWVHSPASGQGERYSSGVEQRLAVATRWLCALLDPATGGVPNLGPNDGAYILPLTGCAFHDYRPVLQASARAFLGEAILGAGLWDEMGMWLGNFSEGGSRSNLWAQTGNAPVPDSLLVLHNGDSWAYLRSANFNNRPGHADQLHLDLWWRGENIARDAGTYLYNAEPPWDNALSRTLVHNTVTVNGLDQMTWAGRFLWLDWAQASGMRRQKAADGTWERCIAEHNGYRCLGVLHRRAVTAFRDGRWLVEDTLEADKSAGGMRNSPVTIRLHWLLPDWAWNLAQQNSRAELEIISPSSSISLSVCWSDSQAEPALIQLVRGGELLSGTGPVEQILGWYSPTYGVKQPALSFSVTLQSELPCLLTSEWRLP
jgi:hypothetical protein